MKQLADGKHMENSCFPRTLKFKMTINMVEHGSTWHCIYGNVRHYGLGGKEYYKLPIQLER
jgi:hypothetical protein